MCTLHFTYTRSKGNEGANNSFMYFLVTPYGYFATLIAPLTPPPPFDNACVPT